MLALIDTIRGALDMEAVAEEEARKKKQEEEARLRLESGGTQYDEKQVRKGIDFMNRKEMARISKVKGLVPSALRGEILAAVAFSPMSEDELADQFSDHGAGWSLFCSLLRKSKVPAGGKVRLSIGVARRVREEEGAMRQTCVRLPLLRCVALLLVCSLLLLFPSSDD